MKKSQIIIFFTLIFLLCIFTYSIFYSHQSNFNTANTIKKTPKFTLKPSAFTKQKTDTSKNANLLTGPGKKVPILYYHCVSNDIFGIDELFVSPTEFEKQMKYLYENNFNIITFDDLRNLGSINNPVILTFDDGYENNYTHAYPILKKYNFKATIFLIVNSINKKNFLKEDQIKSMLGLINFQSHTLTHPDLRTLDNEEIEYEISESIKTIEKITSQKSNVFAYPIGYYNENVLKITKKYFNYAVTNIGGLYYNNIDNYEIKRVYIPRSLTLNKFIEKF